MRRHRRNRLRSWLRNRWFPDLSKGKNCGHGRHEFEECDEGVLACKHCDKRKERTLIRWAV